MNMYKTADLNLAAFLIASGFTLRDSVREGKVSFLFDNTNDLQDAIQIYYSGDNHVNANKFVSAQKMLKNIVYDNN